jgi:crotonobetainyl-CoA:carnitine CoA-transferase CaiB-like acyl-CoA transferase
MSPKALEGIKVVELGDYISAPFCARLLADLGAEVIKIEPPYGSDSSRRNGPFPFVQEDGQEDGDGPNAEASGLFLFLNTGKMGITLDVTTPTGRDMLLQLLEEADILVENHSPGHIEQLKLDYPSLKERFPRLIVTSISPFGQTGPYKDYAGYDLNVQAAGGISIGIGMPDREPLAIPLSQADYMAGLAGAASTLIALLARDVTGRGQLVDVSESQVLAVLISFVYFLPNFIYRGVAVTRKGKRGGEAYFPNTIMPCKDGFVCLYPLQIHQYLRLLKLMGDPDWQENPRYRNRRAMAEEYPDEAEALIAPWFMERTKEEIFKLCLEHKVPCGPVRTIEEIAGDPHLEEREYFVNVEHPVAGVLAHPGSPFRLSRTPGEVGGPAPLLGQHNASVYCGRLALSQEDLARLRMAGIV